MLVSKFKRYELVQIDILSTKLVSHVRNEPAHAELTRPVSVKLCIVPSLSVSMIFEQVVEASALSDLCKNHFDVSVWITALQKAETSFD